MSKAFLFVTFHASLKSSTNSYFALKLVPVVSSDTKELLQREPLDTSSSSHHESLQPYCSADGSTNTERYTVLYITNSPSLVSSDARLHSFSFISSQYPFVLFLDPRWKWFGSTKIRDLHPEFIETTSHIFIILLTLIKILISYFTRYIFRFQQI